jgi:tetratricopeptide (TPR) repeat protein
MCYILRSAGRSFLQMDGNAARAEAKIMSFAPLLLLLIAAWIVSAASALAQDVRTQARHSPVVDPTRGHVTLTFSGGCTVGITPAELKDINLALLYRVQGRYADAEPLYKRALAIGEKALGPDHPAVAIRLNNLALLYRVQGRYADAEPLYKRALAIDEKALGPDHPAVAIRLNNLAGLYCAQGHYAEAAPQACPRDRREGARTGPPQHKNNSRNFTVCAKHFVAL